MATIITTQIPYSATALILPGAGAEQWHNGSQRIPNPTATQPVGTENSLDVYYRFQWTQVEIGNGVYSWTHLDNLIRGAINKGQKLSFGIMSVTPGSEQNHIMIGAFKSSYPLYLHNLMQAETNKDFTTGDLWVPNYNSPNYIARLKALNEAIYNRLLTETYTPTSGPNQGKVVRYFDAIGQIDIRGYGSYGEWHQANDVGEWSNYPSGRVPTAASLIAIIDAHTTAFKNIPLVAMVATFGAQQLGVFHQHPQVSHYAAVIAKNDWGMIGWRKDQYGATDGYLGALLENNNITYNGSAPLKTYILDRWKTSPITGEPPSWTIDGTDLLRQVNQYHTLSFGNGNYGPTPSLTLANQIREAFKRAGYRLTITGGSYTNTNTSVSLTLNWQNLGICPTYENWNVAIYLKNSSGNIAAQTVSTFKPKLFLPNTVSTIVTDNFNFSVPSGTYTLAIKVVDPTNYRAPMPLFITGVQSDGSYNLGLVSVGTVTTTTTLPPTTTTTTTRPPTTTTTTTRSTTTTTTTTIPPTTSTTTTTTTTKRTIKSVTQTILYTDNTTSTQVIT